MKVNQVLPYFDGRQTKLAEALGITQPAISQWITERDGEIPELHALKLEHVILPALRKSAGKNAHLAKKRK